MFLTDRCTTQQRYDKAVLKNGGTLESVPDRKMSTKKCVIKLLIMLYVHALEFVPNCYKTQKMCNKAVNTYPSAMQFVPEYCYTQEIYDRVVSEDRSCFMLIYCPDRYKT